MLPSDPLSAKWSEAASRLEESLGQRRGSSTTSSSRGGTKRKVKPLPAAAVRAIRQLSRLPEAAPFARPVDPVEDCCSDYFDKIPEPMDLGTIVSRIKDDFYWMTDGGEEESDGNVGRGGGGEFSCLPLFRDLERVWGNCFSYNGSDFWLSAVAAELRQRHCVEKIYPLILPGEREAKEEPIGEAATAEVVRKRKSRGFVAATAAAKTGRRESEEAGAEVQHTEQRRADGSASCGAPSTSALASLRRMMEAAGVAVAEEPLRRSESMQQLVAALRCLRTDAKMSISGDSTHFEVDLGKLNVAVQQNLLSIFGVIQ